MASDAVSIVEGPVGLDYQLIRHPSPALQGVNVLKRRLTENSECGHVTLAINRQTTGQECAADSTESLTRAAKVISASCVSTPT